MNWDLDYVPEAKKDIKDLDRSQQIVVTKALKKVKSNPLPQDEGGYGKPLGKKHGRDLTNFLKVKLRGEGIRIVYKLIHTETKMLVVYFLLDENMTSLL
jgi:mRNA interferase RelE/StbE